MEFFFNWMAKPLNPEDVDAWFRANNIIPEYSELFKDFCFSLLFLIGDTYLGHSHGDSRETQIGMTTEEKKQHFEWCWNTTLKNFEKENICLNSNKMTMIILKVFSLRYFMNNPISKLGRQ